LSLRTGGELGRQFDAISAEDGALSPAFLMTDMTYHVILADKFRQANTGHLRLKTFSPVIIQEILHQNAGTRIAVVSYHVASRSRTEPHTV